MCEGSLSAPRPGLPSPEFRSVPNIWCFLPTPAWRAHEFAISTSSSRASLSSATTVCRCETVPAATKTEHFVEETKDDLATRPVWRTMDQSLGEQTVQQTR